MRIYDIIMNKRDGLANSYDELSYLIDHYMADEIHDDQMAAWLMAVYFQGMNDSETAHLTKLMMHSGEVLDLSGIKGTVVDKHSTGGVGDKTTLVVAPIVAAAGVPIAKLSGKGLGFTGGTIDKLEAIPGFKTNLSNQAFISQVNDIGLAIIGQTQNLVPADKKLYGLRDLTATVDSIPLIASSIMSKKLASGAQKILLDVKFGSGAFMKTLEQAEHLAQTMVNIGKSLQRETVAVLSSMAQPLGYAIGNALETLEAIETLKGHGPKDLLELSAFLAGHLLHLHGQANSDTEGIKTARQLIQSGQAYRKFLQLVACQNGDVTAVENGALLQATETLAVLSEREGYVTAIDAMAVGYCSMMLGAGREQKGDKIDLAAGIVLNKKIGDYVEAGELLAMLYYNPPFAQSAREIRSRLRSAYLLDDEKPLKLPPLIDKIIY